MTSPPEGRTANRSLCPANRRPRTGRPDPCRPRRAFGAGGVCPHIRWRREGARGAARFTGPAASPPRSPAAEPLPCRCEAENARRPSRTRRHRACGAELGDLLRLALERLRSDRASRPRHSRRCPSPPSCPLRRTTASVVSRATVISSMPPSRNRSSGIEDEPAAGASDWYCRHGDVREPRIRKRPELAAQVLHQLAGAGERPCRRPSRVRRSAPHLDHRGERDDGVPSHRRRERRQRRRRVQPVVPGRVVVRQRVDLDQGPVRDRASRRSAPGC